jgi:uncharacterized Zn finger protein (UPF0148 family)
MSALEVLQKINKKLDQGWKMSDQTCPVCKTIIVGNLTTKEFYCCKCDMPAKFVFDDEESDDGFEVQHHSPHKFEVIEAEKPKEKEVTPEEYDNMIFKREQERRKSDVLSKKMGDLLLQGWAMLEDTCALCLFPLMRSKKGEYLCVGCGPVDMNKKEAPKKVVEPEMMAPKMATSEKKEVKFQDMKKEEPKKEHHHEKKMEMMEESHHERRDHHSHHKEGHMHHKEGHMHHGEDRHHEEREHSRHSHHSSEDESHGRMGRGCPRGRNHSNEDERRRPFHGGMGRGCPMMMMKGQFMEKMMESGRINESLDFYSTLSQGLNSELKKMMNNGVMANLSQIEKLMEMQMKVDQAKKDLFPKFHHHNKDHHANHEQK